MMEVMQAFCEQWDRNTWQVAFTGAVSYLFDLPNTQLAADEDATDVVSNSNTCHIHFPVALTPSANTAAVRPQHAT